MHVDRFYPMRLHRHWSVADGAASGVRDDGKGRPHSLWLTKQDAYEMRWRLDEQCGPEPAYWPLGSQTPLQPLEDLPDMNRVLGDTETLWNATLGIPGHGELGLALGEALRALRKARLLHHLLALQPREERNV